MTAAIFRTIHMQDKLDKENTDDKDAKLLLRLLVNFSKIFIRTLVSRAYSSLFRCIGR